MPLRARPPHGVIAGSNGVRAVSLASFDQPPVSPLRDLPVLARTRRAWKHARFAFFYG